MRNSKICAYYFQTRALISQTPRGLLKKRQKINKDDHTFPLINDKRYAIRLYRMH